MQPYARNVYSQTGEDGVLEHLLQSLDITDDWCVEFGAWDGKYLSNTYKLMEEGWSGVFIEGDPIRYRDLQRTYSENVKAHTRQIFVSFSGKDTLDNVLSSTPIPTDFAVLSIDIDGNDYHIWESLTEYHPKIVVVEFNPTIPPHIDFVQPKDMSVNQGNSLKAYGRLAREKGYELADTTLFNAFFVRADLFTSLTIGDNSPEAMFRDRRLMLDVYQLFDGTVVFSGNGPRLWWHAVHIRPRFQVLPRAFRRYPETMGPVRLFLFRVWRRLAGLTVAKGE